jgi:hypothetical protein
MKIDNFVPAGPNKCITYVVGVGAVSAALPLGGASLELSNAGTAIVFIELGDAQVAAATVAGSYPILPGQSKVIDRKQNDTTISTISGSAAQSLIVAPGIGS